MSRTYHAAILVTNRTDYFSNHDMLSGIHQGLTALEKFQERNLQKTVRL